MKIAVVIPTLNAVKRGMWQELLAAVAQQDLDIARKIVIDSASDDATCAIAASFRWECRTIRRQDFNHGGTRDAIVRELAQEGIDTVIFLSQDVILAAPDSLRKLTGFLWSHPVSGCFGMQRARREHALNAWQRLRCYPAKSEIKTVQDAGKRGMMTVFFSNAFSAWKTAEIIRCGGFPETDFGEDMLLAARVLNQGGAIGYCAESAVWHDHPECPKELFCRGVQIGLFHRRHPELLRQFGKKLPCSAAAVPIALWLPLGIKFLGFLWGHYAKGGLK